MAPPTLPRWPVALSVAAAVLTIGMKAAAYAATGSAGLLADALESVVNLLAAGTAYLSLGYAARPADRDHAYGHEKIEYFSSGLEGVLIVLAGAGTAAFAARRLVYPEPLEALGLGTAIAVAAALVNLLVARVLLRYGRRHRSIVLEADGEHLMADVWTTAGVLAGLGLVGLTGWAELDSLVAAAVGLHIAWTGVGLVRRSFDGLMDHALPTADQEVIRRVIGESLPPGAAFHALRTRQAGSRRFAEFHLLVDGDWSVREAHHLAHRVADALAAAVPGLEVVTHVEPVDERESWEPEYLKQLGEPEGPDGR